MFETAPAHAPRHRELYSSDKPRSDEFSLKNLDIRRLPGGLDGQFNQQWSSSSRRQKNKYDYLSDLSFIDWNILHPPKPPKVKKSKKVKAVPVGETPEEAEARARDEQIKKEQAEKRAAEEQLLKAKKAELEDKFMKFSGGSSTMNTTQVALAAREFGYAPDLADLSKLEEKCANGCGLDELMAFMADLGGHIDEPDDLMEFFKSYDRLNEGTLRQAQVANLMRTYGEPLTKEEFDVLIDLAGLKGQDPMSYVQFVNFLCSTD
eukprot:GHVH01001577.1.p1 GENE.GHVH01001577.1~~GHVH01001577.1.p1  ORF type:complete len:263 (+),score=40.89 GHVH01001577.1:126-914(+)